MGPTLAAPDWPSMPVLPLLVAACLIRVAGGTSRLLSLEYLMALRSSSWSGYTRHPVSTSPARMGRGRIVGKEKCSHKSPKLVQETMTYMVVQRRSVPCYNTAMVLRACRK